MLDVSFLENIYTQYNDAEWVGLDPLQFVLRFSDPRDQEVIGLLSASLAYGQIKSISASMEKLMAVMGPEPARWLLETDPRDQARALPGFKHRWTNRDDILSLWLGMQRVTESHGSLEAVFKNSLEETDSFQVALDSLVQLISTAGEFTSKRVLASPVNGSACKRMLMYLRWMIRSDNVDPGPWSSISPSTLHMPLDVHIHRIARTYGLTRRKAADWKAVEEVTAKFRKLSPEDPVRYDFALTRLSMSGPDTVKEALKKHQLSSRLHGNA